MYRTACLGRSAYRSSIVEAHTTRLETYFLNRMPSEMPARQSCPSASSPSPLNLALEQMDIRALIHPYYVHHRNLAAINAAFMNLFRAIGQLSSTDESARDIFIPLCDASRRAQKRGLVAPMPAIPVPLLDQNDVETHDEVESLGNLVHLVASLAELVTNLTSSSAVSASSVSPIVHSSARNGPSHSNEMDSRPLLRSSSSFVVIPSMQYPGEHFSTGTVEDFRIRRHNYLHDARIRVRAWLSRKDTLRRSRQYRHQQTPDQQNVTGISITWPIPSHDTHHSRPPTEFGMQKRGEGSDATRNRPLARRAASQPHLRTDESDEKDKPLPVVPLHLASCVAGSSKTTIRVEGRGRKHEHSTSDPTGLTSRLRKPKPCLKVAKRPPLPIGSTSHIEMAASTSGTTSNRETSAMSSSVGPTGLTSDVPIILADSNPYAKDVNKVHRVRRKPVPTLSTIENPLEIPGETSPSDTSVTAVVALVHTGRTGPREESQAGIPSNGSCSIAVAEPARRPPTSYHPQKRTTNRTNHAPHPVTSQTGDYYTIRVRSTPSDGRYLARSSPCIPKPIPAEPLPQYTPPAVGL